MNTQLKRPARAGRSKSNGARKSTVRPVSFAALPEEIERWKKAAEADRRTLAAWIRNRLIERDAQDGAMPSDSPARSSPAGEGA